MKNFLIKTCSSVFGLGYMPVAPGTFGTLGAFILWLVFFRYLDRSSFMVALVLIIFFSCYIAELASKIYKAKDPQKIVIDELCGFLVAVSFSGRSLLMGLLGFALFRLFDILKPWPVKKFESLPGGLGIVMDDVMAGVYGAFVLGIVSYFIG